MNTGYGNCFDLADRISNAFPDIEDDICVDLRENSNEYIAMWQEFKKLSSDCTIIARVMEDKGAVTITAEEHEELAR